MPRRHPDSCAWVLERLVLQPRGVEPESGAERQQALLVGAHQMHHGLIAVAVPMQPYAAVEGEAQTLAAARELPVRRVYWQLMRPSVVAGATGGAAPENRAQALPVAKELVTLADQPPGTVLRTGVVPVVN